MSGHADSTNNDNVLDEVELTELASKFSIALSESTVLDELKDLLDVILNMNFSDVSKIKGSWAQLRLDGDAFELYINALLKKIHFYAEFPNKDWITNDSYARFEDMLENMKSTIDEFKTFTLPQLKPATPQHFKHIETAFIQTFSPFVSIIENLTGHTHQFLDDDFLKITSELNERYNELDNVFGDTSGINTKLNEVRRKVRKLTDKSEDLEDKVNTINTAKTYVEQLPKIIENLDLAKSDIEDAKEQSDQDKFQIQENLKEIQRHLGDIRGFQVEASKLVDQCKIARQITTTESLGKGFEDKAKSLKTSIRCWVLGLTIGLTGGAFLAHLRIMELGTILEQELTTGQSILHLAITICALAGPLWWAWLCTSQINKTFKLSEDYSYKASVAKAYTGFQDEAARFDEKIATRLFASAVDRFDEMPLRLIDPKDHSTPWQDILHNTRFSHRFGKSIEDADRKN